MDEQNHIARGLAFLRTGDPRLSVEHPPLLNSLSALPLLTLPVTLPTDDWSWQAGEWYRFADLLMWQANHDAERMVFLARLPIILLACLMGALVYRVARKMAASSGGRLISDPALLALGLYVFDPNILAHSRYATTDLGVTAFVFLAAVALWQAGKHGFPAGRVLVAGVTFGLALAAKLSAAVFGLIFGLLALMDLARHWHQERRPPVGALLRLGTLYPLAALLVVWAVFGFGWGPISEGGWSLPMPVFWRGVGAILDFSGGGRPAYLLGHFSTEGFVAYFPVALAVKTPLPTLILLAWALVRLAVIATRGGRMDWRQLAYLLAPPALYFAVSIGSALNLGYRHLLPMLPFLFVFIATQLGTTGGRLALWSMPALASWLLIANLAIFPHYLSYFNELVGPSHGYKVLVDSNIDWGQDLERLRDWMSDNHVERVKLAWFGSAPPEYYGIMYDPLPGLPHHFDLWENLPFDSAAPEPGIYAISVSILEELYRRDEDKTAFTWFRAREPDDRIGYSILIYRVGT